MVTAISLGFSLHYNDPEYLRIRQELLRFGIAPSGNKAIDKGKLEQAKTELIQKIQVKQEAEEKQYLEVQPLEEVHTTEQARIEDERLGAMTLAELNKIYFGL